jgi:nitronate monooxygenase
MSLLFKVQALSRYTNLHPQPLAGNESGGHGSSKSPAVRTLLAEVLAALPPGHPPILAAGGLGSGRDLAEMITTHGADGAVMGTRFLATTESLYPEAKKVRICEAKAEDTVRSLAFDLARGTTDWPKDIDGRGLRNKSVEDYDTGVDAQRLRAAYDQALATKDFNRLEVWAGTGVGHVTKISSTRVSFGL